MTVKAPIAALVRDVASLQFTHSFNPYSDVCASFDLPDAPAIRRRNLSLILEAAAVTGVDDLWIGLELGHKGGRRTGLAMTDDRHLQAHAARFGVQGTERATRAGPETELTAGIVWEALAMIDRPVFLWNVVPVHPHQPAIPLSNRRHSRQERNACLPHLARMIDLLKPKRLVALGNDAAAALNHAGYAHETARHPAFGGKQDFLRQVGALG